MQTEITFHQLDHSDAVEAAVQRWIARLEHLSERMTKCSVTLDQPHKRRRHGGEYHVSIVLEVPGAELAATHDHVDVYVAIADAFRALRRQLQDHLDVQQGYVKTNVVGRTGHVGANVDKQRMGM
jgi:ribosomal subunit interface protein